jgi:hypothetical protein
MRIDVFGLTFAETALVLLFGVFAAMLAGKTEENRALKEISGQRQQIATLQQDLKTERQNNTTLTRNMAELLPKLRSSAFPSCAETGIAEGWLFTATVKGRDAFEVDGISLTLSNLLNNYSTQLRQATESECRERVRLYVGKDISGADYEYALRRISQHFYVGYMGSR